MVVMMVFRLAFVETERGESRELGSGSGIWVVFSWGPAVAAVNLRSSNWNKFSTIGIWRFWMLYQIDARRTPGILNKMVFAFPGLVAHIIVVSEWFNYFKKRVLLSTCGKRQKYRVRRRGQPGKGVEWKENSSSGCKPSKIKHEDQKSGRWKVESESWKVKVKS